MAATGRPKGTVSASDERNAGSSRRDPVEISSEGRDTERSQAGAAATARAGALPEEREDRIEEARSRVDSGYYDSPEVQDQLAGKLAQTLTGSES